MGHKIIRKESWVITYYKSRTDCAFQIHEYKIEIVFFTVIKSNQITFSIRNKTFYFYGNKLPDFSMRSWELNTVSISANSIRNPSILTWSSILLTNMYFPNPPYLYRYTAVEGRFEKVGLWISEDTPCLVKTSTSFW